MCRPSGTRLITLIVPGTAVAAYRLFRPSGTASLRHLPTALSAARASMRFNKPFDL
jgi:hypothetical protein